jgi:ABC-type transporter Mla subunit MlaD
MAGTAKHFPNAQFTLGGTVYTTASLTQLLTQLVNALTAVAAAHASVKDAIAALKGVAAQVDPVMRAYRRYVLAAFSNATQELADFGMQPPKARKPRTSEQNAAAAAKAKATRTARGTASRKKKLAITGDVTGVKITPVTGSEASAASAPSAPTASSTTSAPPANAGSTPK